MYYILYFFVFCYQYSFDFFINLIVNVHRTVNSEVDSDSEEELDLEKLKAKMMDDSILPSSPSVKSKPKVMDEVSSTVKLKANPEPPLVAGVTPGFLSDDSDIDSDREPDDFPLSKSVVEPEIKEEPRSDSETKLRLDAVPKPEPTPAPARFRFDSLSKQEEEIKTEKMEVKPNPAVLPDPLEVCFTFVLVSFTFHFFPNCRTFSITYSHSSLKVNV